jgi:trk system potassium uptake protein TrkH
LRFKVVFHIVGLINMILSLVMLTPLFVSLFFDEGDTGVFIVSFLITGLSGLLLFFLCRTSLTNLSHRLGFVIVAACWISASIFCSLPFILSGVFPSVIDAVFEAVSGLTTTGASILPGLEGIPHGILFWRSLTHWIGGMGIVILGLAILPLLGIGGMQLYKAEASAVTSDKLAPRVKGMARILVTVYLLMSFVLLVFLLISGMGLFDAFNHAFSTIATGGFSSRSASVGEYNNFMIELVIMTFMVLGATNFALHYRFYHEGIKGYLRNSEFKFYLLVLAGATILIAFNLWGNAYDGIADSFRYSSFQVISIMTTTGFSTADYASWPVFSQGMLIVLMFIGGSAGSTTGAIKCIRILLLVKVGHREIYKLIHPHAVKPVKLNGKPVEQDVLNAVMGFTFLYIAVFVVSAALLSLQGLDFLTAISSAASALSCVGPALGTAGPMDSFAHFPALSKCVFIADMLLGRLELYTLLILFVPAFWRG